MSFYEKAQLKGQKLNLASLISKPEYKQQYFAPIRSLDADDQADLLSKVVSREISLGELKIKAQERKQMKLLRTAFVKLTNCVSACKMEYKHVLYIVILISINTGLYTRTCGVIGLQYERDKLQNAAIQHMHHMFTRKATICICHMEQSIPKYRCAVYCKIKYNKKQ